MSERRTAVVWCLSSFVLRYIHRHHSGSCHLTEPPLPNIHLENMQRAKSNTNYLRQAIFGFFTLEIMPKSDTPGGKPVKEKDPAKKQVGFGYARSRFLCLKVSVVTLLTTLPFFAPAIVSCQKGSNAGLSGRKEVGSNQSNAGNKTARPTCNVRAGVLGTLRSVRCISIYLMCFPFLPLLLPPPAYPLPLYPFWRGCCFPACPPSSRKRRRPS